MLEDFVKKLPFECQMVTKTYLKPIYLPTYATVMTVMTVETVVTVVKVVTVVTVVTLVTVGTRKLFPPKNCFHQNICYKTLFFSQFLFTKKVKM